MHVKSNGSRVMANVKVDLDGWPWPWYITAQHVQLYEIQLYAKYEFSVSACSKTIVCVKVDLEEWPWPWHVTTHHVLLYEIHLQAKFKCLCVSLKVITSTFIFDLWPFVMTWRMTLTLTFHCLTCAALWDTLAYQIWSLSFYWFKSFDML